MKKADQPELFQAETTWFHVFKTMIDCGDVAKMGPHAVTVYLVVKSHTNFATGRAFPALETIAEKSGVSLAQVKRELKILEEFGYITKEKKGRSNSYTLREKIELRDEAGRPAAVATWDYLPSSVSAAVADLKNVMVTGNAEGARMVHIERLTVNVAQAGGTVININESSIPPAVREQMEAILRDYRASNSSK
jgi:DNA-binding transcriptional ArsR family regulator